MSLDDSSEVPRGVVFSEELIQQIKEALDPDWTLLTLTQGRPNRINHLDEDGVLVSTERSERRGTGPQLVPAWMVIRGWEHLRRTGRLSQDELLNALGVKRSAFVCALLAVFPDVEVESVRPTVLRLN